MVWVVCVCIHKYIKPNNTSISSPHEHRMEKKKKLIFHTVDVEMWNSETSDLFIHINNIFGINTHNTHMMQCKKKVAAFFLWRWWIWLSADSGMYNEYNEYKVHIDIDFIDLHKYCIQLQSYLYEVNSYQKFCI